MKRIFVMLLSLLMLSSFAACSSAGTLPVEKTQEESQSISVPEIAESEPETEQPVSSEPIPSTPAEEETQQVKIKLTANGETAIVELLENDAAADFVSMLPLTLTFEDYNSTEKIATLPEELNTGSAPTSCDPDAGTFAYYAPWGNLSVFYKDFRESESLIPLGTFESGIDILAGTEGEFTVTIELEVN